MSGPCIPAGMPGLLYTTKTWTQNVWVYGYPWKAPDDITIAPWTFQDKESVKSGVKGKKIKMSFGYWSPCRAYTRGVAKLNYTGANETLRNTFNNVIIQSLGRPLSYPVRPLNFMFGGGIVDTTGVPLSPSANTRNRLITECIQKINDRKMQLGSMLAESGKTIEQIASLAIRVLTAYRALRHGNITTAFKAIGITVKGTVSGKDAARFWLEHRYGWLPLLSDIYDLTNTLKNGLGQKAPILHATRNLGDTAQWSQIGNQSFSELKGVLRYNYRCKLWYVLSDATILRLSQLQVINPLEVAWELLPYSFVVDWFLPIGNVLEAWTATWGLDYLDGCISSYAKGVAGGFHNEPPTYYQWVAGTPSYWDINQFGLRRDPIVDPVPGLYLKSPFSTTHVISALALIRNLRK